MIIDASVAFKWLVEEPDSAAALGWIGQAELSAPSLLFVEVANALWKRIRRGELIGEGAEQQLGGLPEIIRTIDESAFVPDALRLARELDHPTYDCVYLAIAEALDQQLLTADGKFSKVLKGTPYQHRLRLL